MLAIGAIVLVPGSAAVRDIPANEPPSVGSSVEWAPGLKQAFSEDLNEELNQRGLTVAEEGVDRVLLTVRSRPIGILGTFVAASEGRSVVVTVAGGLVAGHRGESVCSLPAGALRWEFEYNSSTREFWKLRPLSGCGDD